MIKHKRLILTAVLLACVLLVALVAAVVVVLSRWQEQDVTRLIEIPRPSGDLIAVAYHVSGGGAAGYTFSDVTILKDDEPLQGNPLFSYQAHAWATSLKWLSDEHLEVTYQTTRPYLIAAETLHGVQISYVKDKD